jgi:tetratricopeptide (TPR) repeat protein
VALRALGQKEAAYRILLTHAAPSNLRERAELALELEDFQRAAEFYQKLVKREGAEASPEARSSLAYALTRLGRGEEAVALYQKIMASDNPSRQDRIRFAWLLNARGEYEKAWEVIKPDPRPSEDLEILELQARTAYWAEKMEEAAPLLKLLIKRKESR